jgi:hypothetical protein
MTSGVKTLAERENGPALAGRLAPACLSAWRRAVAAWRPAALLLVLASAAAPGFAFDFKELMGLLGQRASGEARFAEQRFVQGLDAPLTASGTLSFVAPDRFTRRTLAPRPETMEVQGNQLTLTRGGRSRSLSIDASPEAAAIVEALRGTLTGNAQALEKHFEPRLEGDADAWTLALTPRDGALARQVVTVRLGGRQRDLRSVEIQLSGGDHSVMTIEPVVAGAAR